MNTKLLVQFLVCFLVLSAQARAQMPKDEFISQCVSKVTETGSAGPLLDCVAATSKDADILTAAGLSTNFSVDLRDSTEVGSYRYHNVNYLMDIAHILDSGFLGFGANVLRIQCRENPQVSGAVEITRKEITVETENKVDLTVSATVKCR